MIKEGLLTSVMGEENRDVHSDKITQLLSHLSIKQCDKMTLNESTKLVRKYKQFYIIRQIRVDLFLLTLYLVRHGLIKKSESKVIY